VKFATLAATISKISNGKLVMFTPLVLGLSIPSMTNALRRGRVSREKRCRCRGCERRKSSWPAHCWCRHSWGQCCVGHASLCRITQRRFLWFGDAGGREKEKCRVGDGSGTSAGRYLVMAHEHTPADACARRMKRRRFHDFTDTPWSLHRAIQPMRPFYPFIPHFWVSFTK
jgi:hypothetical protein